MELTKEEQTKLINGLIDKTEKDEILWIEKDIFTTTVNDIEIGLVYSYNNDEKTKRKIPFNNIHLNIKGPVTIVYDCDLNLIECVMANVDRQHYNKVLKILAVL